MIQVALDFIIGGIVAAILLMSLGLIAFNHYIKRQGRRPDTLQKREE